MKNLKKLAAAVLAVTVSAAATGSIAYAKNSDKTDKTDSTAKTEGEKETSERESNGENAYKDETVYVMCNNDASVKNVVVSDWLKNPSALTSLSDISSLEDIVNVKGDEAFTVNGEDISWSADGSDIYYKGNSDKELPVDVNIQYFLDGKEVTADSIKGKSGHLTIRWTYTNSQKVTKEIGGRNKEIYVPFMAASAAVLAVKFLVKGRGGLSAVEHKYVRSHYVHKAEVILVVIEHIVHAALVVGKKHHALHFAGEWVHGNAFYVKALHKVLCTVRKACFQLRMGIDEDLNA